MELLFLIIFFGTYTGNESKGIYSAKLNLKTGEIGEVQLAAETKSPAFLAVHPSGDYLYAVNETGNGTLTAFKIDKKTRKLEELNSASSEGGGPCHITIDKSGKYVYAANYGGGSVVGYAIEEDGKLGKKVAFIQHEGSSVNKSRQKGPHAHSVDFDISGQYLLSADLGIDKVLVYKFDPATGALTPNDPAYGTMKPGSGPRHLNFTPDGKFCYVLGELDSTVNAFKWDATKGALEKFQSVSSKPEGHKGGSTAEIFVHPSGRFVYSSNRGHDSVAAFEIDQKSGELTLVDIEKSGGKTPRNFNIDPTGKILVACNQNSSDVFTFKIDPKSGALEPTGKSVKIGKPVCVVFVK